jgi:tryptophanyl-tRNA synthetase
LTPLTEFSPTPNQPSPILAPTINVDQAQVVDPWDVKGAVVDGVQMEIDYNKLIEQFGTKPITPQQLQRFEHLTQRKLHPLLRRGMFFSHRLVMALIYNIIGHLSTNILKLTLLTCMFKLS